jgi:succinate dehydrogenase / fumarate reductase membrane anchor subunit
MTETGYRPGMRTALGKVRGLGASRGGTADHIAIRVSSIALLFLTPWFILSAATSLKTYEAARAWAGHPLNAVLAALFVIAAFHHMQLGMRVVIEDYIHKHNTKAAFLVLNYFLCAGLAAASLFAIVRLSLGA